MAAPQATVRGSRCSSAPTTLYIPIEPEYQRHPDLALPIGTQPGALLPDCESCGLDNRRLCSHRQSLNYQMQAFVFAFVRPECEAALTGSVDIYELLSQGTYSIAELAKLTGKCYGTLWRELRLMKPRGVNIVGHGPHQEALYAVGAPEPKPIPDHRGDILAALHCHGPLLAREIAVYAGIGVATVRLWLNSLLRETPPQVAVCGKRQFKTEDGLTRQAPVWRCVS